MRNIDLTGGTELVTETECWNLLHTVEYGRLAVVDGDARPDIFPVNFHVAGRSLVVQTNMGHKLLAALREGSAVAFEADVVDRESRTAWSVVIHGHARDASAEQMLRDIPQPWTGSKAYRLEIVPETFSGRRFRIPTGSPATT